MSTLSDLMGTAFSGPLTLSQMNFTAPLDSVPLPEDFKIPEGSTLTFSTTATGKPVAHISGPPQGDPSRHWAPNTKENQQVASTNSKAYKVVLTDGTERVVEANSVVEADGRLKFTGAVEGHESNYSQDTVASFLSDSVVEYGVVPVHEEAKVGHNTYRVFFTEGSSQEVQADKVLYTKGSEKGNGQFTFVTSVRSGENRTEYLIGEDLVHHIERADGATVPAQDGPRTGEKLSA